MEVRKVSDKADIIGVLDLALEVFMQFEAPDYCEEGIETFRSFINSNKKVSDLSYYGAYVDGKLVGMLAIRGYQHLSLFFVKSDYQSKGVGRLLFETMKRDYKKQLFTVNAAPFAVDIYRSLGFMNVSDEKITDGVRYTPMVSLETERLRLRKYSIDDFKTMHEIFSDTDTMRYYPHPFSPQETEKWILRNIERYQKDGFGLWPVVLKSTGEVIGDCGITLQNINGSMLPEIGYHINKKYQRKGYATEAAQICIDYAFRSLGFPAVYSYMKYTNVPSYSVAEKCGMKFTEEYDDPINTKTKVYKLDNYAKNSSNS